MLFVALFIFYNSDVVIHGHMIGFRFRTKFKILEKISTHLEDIVSPKLSFLTTVPPPPTKKPL
jgi:hypothetical protein